MYNEVAVSPKRTNHLHTLLAIPKTDIIRDRKRIEKRQGGSRQSRLKCNSCKLKFDNNKDRGEHEQTWYATTAKL